MGFILCESCGCVIGTSEEGDHREGFCNWCEAFNECHGSSEYDDYSWDDDYYEEVPNND